MQTLSQQYPDLMLPVKVVPLSRGMFAIVDPEDFAAVWAAGPWYAIRGKKTWYARHDDDSKLERVVTVLHTFLTGFAMTDHINRNGLDNRRVNLRETTYALNNRNRGIQSNNTSGYVGVYYHKAAKKWLAQVYRQRKRIHIGQYETPEEAHAAREEYIGRTSWREVE